VTSTSASAVTEEHRVPVRSPLLTRIGVVGALSLVLVGTGAGWAQADEPMVLPTPVVTPASAPAGTPLTISGVECLEYGKDYQGGMVVLVSTDVAGVTAATTSSGPADVDSTGAWSTQLTFPAGTAPGQHRISVACTYYAGGDVDQVYPDVAVEVTGSTPPVSPPAPAPAPTTTAVLRSNGPVCQSCADLTPGAAVARGEQLSITLGGFAPGELVRGILRSTPIDLGTARADGAGVVTFRFAVPAGIESGEHTLTLSGDQGSEVVLAVAVDGTVPGAATLASTGAAPAGALGLGAALVLVGVGATWAGRRRRVTAAR
jgi:hypothetical protein